MRLLLLLATVGIVVLAIFLAARPNEDCAPPTPEKGPGGESGEARGEDQGSTPDGRESRRGEIFGTVRFAGAPVAAHVELRRLPLTDPDTELRTGFADSAGSDPASAAVNAGGSGAFLFRGLETGRYELLAKAGAATGAASVEIRHPGERVRMDIAIPSGPHMLTGRATFEDGRPFEGLVAVVDPEKRTRIPGSPGVRPDGEGRFSIPGLEADVVRISCHLPGELRYLGKKVRIPYDGEYPVVVDGGTTSLKGRVVAEDDGAPVSGAEVTVFGDTAHDRWDEVVAQTDADGSFAVRTLPSWRRITVRASGFSLVGQGIDDGVDQIEIRLGRAGSVSGRVLSADDRCPRPGITVHYRPLDLYHPDPGGQTVSDAEGRFAFESLPNCEIMLYALGAGWITPGVGAAMEMGANPLAVRVAPGAVVKVDLEVVRTFRVKGRVLDDRGEGAEGIVVRASVWANLEFMAPKTLESLTDGLGRFCFDALVPETVYAVDATAPGRAAVRSVEVVGSSGETAEVVLHLTDETSPPRWLDLLVVETSSGEPVSGARVFGGRLEGRTDSDGRARLGPLPPGRVGIWVYHPDCMLLQGRPILEETSGVLSLTVRLRRGLAVAGRVLLPDGNPLENGTVLVKSVDATDGSAPGRSAIGEVTADGRFRAGGLLAGKVQVKIGGNHDGGGYWAERVVEAGEEDLVLTTERFVGQESQTLILRVVDPEGKPVPRAIADLRFAREGTTWEDEHEVWDGEAAVEFWDWNLTVTVSICGACSFSGAPLPFGSALRGPIPLRAGVVEIRLPPEAAIEGTVKTPDGTGVRGVRVEAFPTYGDALDFDKPHAVAFTNDRGTFRLPGLGATEYRLTLSAPEAYLPVEPVIAPPGAERIPIEITRGDAVRLTILDSKRAPLTGAWVTADTTDDRAWRHSSTVARADGTALLTGLDRTRRHLLKVTPPSGRRDLLSVTVKEWRPADGEVVLREGGYVSGAVREENGERASGVIVQARFNGGDWEGKEVARDGSFRFGPYGDGLVELAARRKGVSFSGAGPETVFVPVGTEGVALTCAPGRILTVRILNWSASYGPARARLTAPGGPRWAVVEADGVATFTGLPEEGAATVWVGPVGDGLFLLLGGIRADSDTVEAGLTRGGAVSGRLILPAGARDPEVRLDGIGYSIGAGVAEDGTFRFTGVPDGKCVVTAHATADRRRVEGHEWTETGGTVEIELGAR